MAASSRLFPITLTPSGATPSTGSGGLSLRGFVVVECNNTHNPNRFVNIEVMLPQTKRYLFWRQNLQLCPQFCGLVEWLEKVVKRLEELLVVLWNYKGG